ncbi:hypothetical protein HY546_01810 [archaeon]|nr:hypothetical protein [archaeon]
MKKRLLITRTRHDTVNQYLYIYSEDLITDAESRGWNLSRVEDEKATESEVESRLLKEALDIVCFNGHGSDDAVYGYQDQKLVDVSSAGLLKDKVVFARSCSALNALGKTAVKAGCKAFVGYNGKFLISHTNEYAAKPLSDPTARRVMEVSNIVAKVILRGNSVKEAVNAAQLRAGELILKMFSSQEPYDAAAFRALYHNYGILSFEGNPEAKA